MGEPTDAGQARTRRNAAHACILALRIAPWLVFGPITGLMSERAIRCYRNGDRILAGLYVVANVLVLIAIPALTVALASRIP